MCDERYKMLFEDAPFGIYRLTVEGGLIEGNPALARMLGYNLPREMMSDVNNAASHLFIDPAKGRELAMRALLSGEFVKDEVKYRRKSGELIDAVVQLRAVSDEDGEVQALEGFLEDITEEQKSNRSPAALRELNEVLVRTIPFGVSVIDEDGVILFCNEEMNKLAVGNVTGRRCWEVYKDDKQRCADCPLFRFSDATEKGTMELTGLLGGKTFQITHLGLIYQGKRAVLEVFHDITERKKLQAEFAQSHKMQSIGTLASGIAHDFNNLLGIIIGNATLIERSGGDQGQSLKRIRTIAAAAGRGASLVKQLQMLARKTEPSLTPVPINRVVTDLTKLLDEILPKSIRLLCNLTEKPPMVNGDPTQIHQVLLNLCLNARDAIDSSGDIIISTEVVPTQTVHKLFPTASSPEYVLVAVSDNGSGMSRETLDHIFEPFFTTKDPGKGSGLGLSLVSGIMEAHHGFVNVQTKPGKGTSFSLYFPVYVQLKAEGSTSAVEHENVPAGNETVLIVEDEEMLNELLASILSTNGYNVLRSFNGHEAVNTYRENADRIALVVSDFGLPTLSGSEVLTWLKETNPDVKFILTTGYIDDEDRMAIIENGAKDIIVKPFSPEELLNKVREVLDN